MHRQCYRMRGQIFRREDLPQNIISKRINARAVIRTALFRGSRVLSVQRVQSHVGVSENSGRYRRCFAPDPLYNAGVTNPKSKQLANKSGKRDDIGSNASWNKFGKPDPKGVQKERGQGSITDLQRNCQQHVSECMCVCVCADRQAGRQAGSESHKKSCVTLYSHLRTFSRSFRVRNRLLVGLFEGAMGANLSHKEKVVRSNGS